MLCGDLETNKRMKNTTPQQAVFKYEFVKKMFNDSEISMDVFFSNSKEVLEIKKCLETIETRVNQIQSEQFRRQQEVKRAEQRKQAHEKRLLEDKLEEYINKTSNDDNS